MLFNTTIKRFSVGPLAFGISAICNVPAMAAEDHLVVTASSSQQDRYSTDENSTASKMPTSRLTEAQSVSVVTEKQLADYQVSQLSESMRFVSGVAQSNTLAGSEDGIVRRGFGSNSDGSVFRDGIRSSQGLNLNATTDKVEVLKGSSSLLYGILNPGGMINIISKKPKYQWHRKVSGQTGSEGGGRGTLDVTGPLGHGWAFRFISEKQNRSYWRGFGRDKHQLIAPSLQWYGEKASFYFGYERFDYNIPWDRGTAFINGKPIDIGYKTRLDDYTNHAWGHNQTFNSHWDYQFNDQWSTKITWGYNQRRYDNNEVRVIKVNPATGVVTRRADANRGFNHKTKYLAWDLIGSPEVLGMTHHLVTGVDYEMNQTYRAHQYTKGAKNTDYNLSSPIYGLTPIVDSSTEKPNSQNLLNRIHSRSVYLKDSIQLNDQWILVAGTRYQHYEQHQSSGTKNILNYRETGNKFLPQTGLVYRVTPNVSIYTSVSKSFTPSTQFDEEGNVGAPEQGTSWETGAKWQVTPNMLTSLAFYRINERNIKLGFNGDTYPVAKARSTGIEWELNGELTPELDISANYSYDQAKIIDDQNNEANNGKWLQNAPRHVGALYLSHNFQVTPLPGQLRVGAGARYMGTRAGDPDNSFNLPHYMVADSFIGWDSHLLGKATHLQLNLNNLFNKHYYTSSGGDLRVAEGQTRNMVLEASVEF